MLHTARNMRTQVDFDLKASWSAEVILRVSGPLIKWFKAKSAECREIETRAIAEAAFIEEQQSRQ
eukprot:16453-Heterococcus_DN1.PRE.2